MTCDELKEQETYLKSVIDTLNQTIATNTNQANLLYLQCLNADTYGGNYPQPPLTSTAVMARLMYLSTIQPPPTTLMNQYYQLYQLLVTIEGQKATLAQTNAMLFSILQQEIEQGC